MQRKTESEPSALNLSRIEDLTHPKLLQLKQLSESDLYSNKIDAKQHGDITIYNYNNSMKHRHRGRSTSARVPWTGGKERMG